MSRPSLAGPMGNIPGSSSPRQRSDLRPLPAAKVNQPCDLALRESLADNNINAREIARIRDECKGDIIQEIYNRVKDDGNLSPTEMSELLAKDGATQALGLLLKFAIPTVFPAVNQAGGRRKSKKGSKKSSKKGSKTMKGGKKSSKKSSKKGSKKGAKKY